MTAAATALRKYDFEAACEFLADDLIYLIHFRTVTRLSATETARNFSEVLNRVAAGEEIEVVRSGAPVAVLAPARGRLLSPDRFRALLASAPPVDDAFAADVREIRARVAAADEPWPS